jgi:hypothetical protein
MSHKGQAFSMDFLVASAIFIIALTIIFTYWGYSEIQIEDTSVQNDMSAKLDLASQIWFREGSPVYWSPGNVVELGMENSNQFNWTKMAFLNNNITYGQAANLIGTSEYYLFYRVYNESNSTLFKYGFYPSQPTIVMRAERVGILNDSIAKVEVILWR